MNNYWKKLLSLILALSMLCSMIVMPVSAAEADSTESVEEAAPDETADGVVASGTCGEDLSWVLTEDGTLTISGTGNMYDYTDEDAPWLADYAEIITSAIIESGVTSIGISAFFNCSNMAAIVIPDSISVIGDGAFENCYTLADVVIPEGVTNIAPYTFINCTKLQSVTIPDSVSGIGEYAFSCCDSLTDITIPDSATNIGNCAFNSCCSLESITIPDGVTALNGVFCCCCSLTSITIPGSVSTIGDGTFGNCTSLTEVIFVGDAPTFNTYAFESTATKVLYPANNETWTEDVMQQYDGTIEWVAYENSSDGNETEDTDDTSVIDSMTSPSMQDVNSLPEISCCELYTANITEAGQSVWVRFTTPSDGTYALLAGLDVYEDLTVALYDDDLNQILASSASTQIDDIYISAYAECVLPAGFTYVLQLCYNADTTGTFGFGIDMYSDEEGGEQIECPALEDMTVLTKDV